MTSTASTLGRGTRPLVVVGFDGTGQSEAALSWAVQEAAVGGSDLRVVIVWEPHGWLPWQLPDQDDRASALREVSELEARARALLGPAAAEVVVIEGQPGPVLVEQSLVAELLVVGSRGHVGGEGLLAGSVSRYCLHRAGCAVVVVGPHATDAPTARLVLSSTLDPQGETDAWVRGWLERRSAAVHVIASYAFRTSEDAIRRAPLLRHIGAHVAEQQDRWVHDLAATLAPDTAVSYDVVEGSTRDVLQAGCRAGDLLVVPAGTEHSLPFRAVRSPIAVVPAALLAPRTRPAERPYARTFLASSVELSAPS